MAIVIWFVCVATITGFLARWGWPFELASHFRLQYAVILLVGAVLVGLDNQPMMAAVAAAFALLNGAMLIPLYARRTSTTGGRTFRALLANVLHSNRSHERLLRLIHSTRPDFVVLEEVNQEWLATLKVLEPGYPSSKLVERPDGCGILLLSRLPFERIEVIDVGSDGLAMPSIIAQVNLEGTRLTLVGTHPLAPANPRYTQARDKQLVGLGELLGQYDGPVMLLGDLNTTSWSPVFRDLVRSAKLRDSRIGFGIQPTWPVGVLPFQIPLDHCLVSSEVVVRKRWVGPNIGSDHYPVIVDFSLKV